MPKTTSAGASNQWDEQVSVNQDGNPVSELTQQPITAGESGSEIPAEQLPAPKTVRKPRKNAQPQPEGA